MLNEQEVMRNKVTIRAVALGLYAFLMLDCAAANENNSVQDFTTEHVAKESDFAKLEKLLGEWHPDRKTLSDNYLAYLEENNITDSYVTFNWGTNRKWMEFGDYRVEGGNLINSGFGFLGYNPIRREIAFREQGVEGAAVNGTVKVVSEIMFERWIEVDRADGTTRRRLDVWDFSQGDGDCFVWTTSFYLEDEIYESPSYEMCKSEDS